MSEAEQLHEKTMGLVRSLRETLTRAEAIASGTLASNQRLIQIVERLEAALSQYDSALSLARQHLPEQLSEALTNEIKAATDAYQIATGKPSKLKQS